MSETVDLGKLEKQISDARKLIAGRDAVAREKQQLESIVERLNGEVDAAEKRLEAVEAKIVAATQHYEHERNRFSLGLQAHQATCDQAKKAAERDASEARRAADQEIASHTNAVGSKRRALDKDIEIAKGEYYRIVQLVTELKARLSALPG